MFMKDSNHKKILAPIFATLLIIGIAMLIIFQSPEKAAQNANNQNNEQNGNQPQQPAVPNDVTPTRMSLVGEYVCLPHKDPNAIHTMECAFGLKTDDGKYYAMDFNLMSQMQPGDLETGKRISANGTFTPIEMLSTDMWRNNYNIVGIFSVTDSLEIVR